MKEHISLVVPADLKYLRLASMAGVEMAGIICEQAGIKDREGFCHAFELAISEAFANSVKHRKDEDESFHVNVDFQLTPEELTVIIRDKNFHFVLDANPPDLDAHPESGYGLFLIRQFMDKVDYRREDDGNVVSMTKRVHSDG